MSLISAVCILDVSSAPDEDDVIIDKGHTVSKVTPDSEPVFFWFDMLARVYNVHTTSRVFNDAPRAVDEIREDHEAKVPGVVLHGSVACRVIGQ